MQIFDVNNNPLSENDKVVVGFYNSVKSSVILFQGHIVQFQSTSGEETYQIEIRLKNSNESIWTYSYSWNKYRCDNIIRI